MPESRINKFDIGTILTVIIEIISGGFWLGSLNEKVTMLEKSYQTSDFDVSGEMSKLNSRMENAEKRSEEFQSSLDGISKIEGGDTRAFIDHLQKNSRQISQIEQEYAQISKLFSQQKENVDSLIGRIEKLENRLADPIGKSENRSSGPPLLKPSDAETIDPQEVQGFIFAKGECERRGNETVCSVIFINNGNKDMTLAISSSRSPRSCLYDNKGNQYPVSVKIGERTGQYHLVETFVPKLKTVVKFVAEDVDPEASSMTVVIGIDQFKENVAIRDYKISK